MQTFFGTAFIFSMIFAVGCIDGGYDGIPMNDNWLGFFIFTAIGLFSGFITIYIQAKEGE
jgi:hypothetical protein|tara:strand:+ start:1521 stop:1700 length:180 start_codon:yes stop_codon:yes gene_type:complete